MSFYKDASLIFLPSGGAGKDTKAYSIKPRDGSGDFTFSRGSNLTATRVDSNGLIEKGRENLLLQSNQFDTTWTLTDTSVTSGQSGYDGSNDAWLLNSTTTGSPRIQQIVSSSGVSTYSVYAKAATDSFIQLRTFMTPSGDASIWVNLSNGTIVNSSGTANVTSSVESIGNGWYRCSLIINGSLSYLRMYPASAFGVYSTSGNGVYIQDAQVEQGLVATEYIESGASTGLAGILEDSPRFDYSGGASCPSLLLEPSRTNLIDYSEYLTHFNSLLTFNSIISPEGLVNAVKIVENTNTNMHGIRKTDVFPTNASAVDYTISIFAKKNQRDFVQIQTYADTTSINSNGFDLTNGTITGDSTNHKIEDYGNGWYRCSFTVSITQSTGGYNFIRIAMGKVNSSFYYTGDNTSGLYLYGFQLEEGSYPTSYIPNHSGGSVTRELDHCFTSSNSVLEEISATYFLEATPIQITSNNLLEVRANGSTNNRILLQTNSSGFLRVLVRAQVSSVLDQNISGAVSSNTKVKIALKYTDGTNISVFVDGVKEIDSDLVIDFSPELNGLDLEGSVTANNDSLKQHQFIFFPTALSDADCITLTS